MDYTSQKYDLKEEIEQILKEQPLKEDESDYLFDIYYRYQNPNFEYNMPPIIPILAAINLTLPRAIMLRRKLKLIEGVKEVYIDVQEELQD